jgi:hypothetical protein
VGAEHRIVSGLGAPTIPALRAHALGLTFPVFHRGGRASGGPESRQYRHVEASAAFAT